MTKLDHNVYFRLLSTMAPHRSVTLSHLADTVHFENTHACELSVLLFLKYSLKCHTAKNISIAYFKKVFS